MLYGFGLVLAVSLAFNGVLVFEQSRQRSHYESELSNAVQPVDYLVWQQQLSDCRRANLQKDSVIYRMQQSPPAAAQAGRASR
ncbi:hypothetical protein GCM10027578_35290 [Spirosoma luteolum]